jgi:drug/metabolite transporter (DMT)-like permease
MPSRHAGLFWCATFVLLDAAQAVAFGSYLQSMDSFLLGFLVFGLSSVACLATAPWYGPGQISIALADPGALARLNACTAGGWISYLGALQIIEPAVAFTIFSGAIPLTLIGAAAFGAREAEAPANRIEVAGNAIIALGIAVLAAVTLGGWSGFVRGGTAIAAFGIALSLISGALMSGMLLSSYRLSRQGVGPAAMFGLRFPLYLGLALAGFALGLDAKVPVAWPELLQAIAVGLLVLAFPIYAVQKAVSLTSTLTLGTATALIPVVVFLMQIAEGRVPYSQATLAGLAVYLAGALVATAGRLHASKTAARVAALAPLQ